MIIVVTLYNEIYSEMQNVYNEMFNRILIAKCTKPGDDK